MVRAYVMINVGVSEYLGVAKTVKEKIAEISGVIKVDTIFGRYDIVAEVEGTDLTELDNVTEKIKNISSVLSTETFICY